MNKYGSIQNKAKQVLKATADNGDDNDNDDKRQRPLLVLPLHYV